MICATDVSLSFGKRILFKDVNIKFTQGNCYGLIGANGAGKSTFLEILAGNIDSDSGNVSVGPSERIAVLKQDQFAYDEETVINTVIMGYEKLYRIMMERDALYTKSDFSEKDGIKSSALEIKFSELNGYEAETEAAVLLNVIKHLTGIDDKFDLISSSVIRQINGLNKKLGDESCSLDASETMMALAVSARDNPLAKRAMECLPKLRGCFMHTSHRPSAADANLFRKLGLWVSTDGRVS